MVFLLGVILIVGGGGSFSANYEKKQQEERHRLDMLANNAAPSENRKSSTRKNTWKLGSNSETTQKSEICVAKYPLGLRPTVAYFTNPNEQKF